MRNPFIDDHRNNYPKITKSEIIDYLGEIRQKRYDLAVIGVGEHDPFGQLVDNNRFVFWLKDVEGEVEASLEIDDFEVMNTTLQEHWSMKESVTLCPEGSRVFIGGLGLGLVLLYLAESKKAKEVVVCEIDERVTSLFAEKILSFLKIKYPEFNVKIVLGDAHEKIKELGLFDWIYMDLIYLITNGTEEEFRPYLNPGGVFSKYISPDVNRWLDGESANLEI